MSLLDSEIGRLLSINAQYMAGSQKKKIPNVPRISTGQGEMRLAARALLQQIPHLISPWTLFDYGNGSRRPSHNNPQNGGERPGPAKRPRPRSSPPHRESRQSLMSRSSSLSPLLQLSSPRLKLGPHFRPITEFVLEFLAVRRCGVPLEAGKPSRKTGAPSAPHL